MLCVYMLITQLCPTLCSPMNCSPPDSSVHGIFQARILEWVAIPFSQGSSQPRDQTQVSHIVGRFFTNEPPGKSWTKFSSVQSFSHVRLFATPWTSAHQASLSITNSYHPNPCPSSWWCHPTISSSVVPFSSCPQSFPASGSFQMSQLFTSGGQSIGVSASTSVLPMNTQDWSPLGWTGWICLQSKGLSLCLPKICMPKP